MGYTWEVCEWWRDKTRGEDYRYHQYWNGESFFKALWVMWKLKRERVHCIKLEWRPNIKI